MEMRLCQARNPAGHPEGWVSHSVPNVERRLRKCRVGTNWLTSLAGLTIEQLRTWDGFSDWNKVDEQHSNSKSVRDFLTTDLLLITKIAYLHGIPKSARHKYRGIGNVVADTQSIAILLNPLFISHRTDYFPDREKYESHRGEDSRHFKVEKAVLRFNVEGVPCSQGIDMVQ
eukprot:jgi/Tetstr1/434948/TSEL_023943.t2